MAKRHRTCHGRPGLDPGRNGERLADRLQVRALERVVRSDAEAPPVDVAQVIEVIASSDALVRLLDASDIRHRDELAPTAAADFALEAAVVVRALGAGTAVEGLEGVVAAKCRGRSFSARLRPVSTRAQVVIADAHEHAEVPRRRSRARPRGLVCLVAIETVERPSRSRQAHHEHPQLDELVGEDRVHVPEINRGRRDRSAPFRLGDVSPGSRLGHLVLARIDQSLEDAPRRVALLGRHSAIAPEPGLDRRHPRPERRRRAPADLAPPRQRASASRTVRRSRRKRRANARIDRSSWPTTPRNGSTRPWISSRRAPRRTCPRSFNRSPSAANDSSLGDRRDRLQTRSERCGATLLGQIRVRRERYPQNSAARIGAELGIWRGASWNRTSDLSIISAAL